MDESLDEDDGADDELLDDDDDDEVRAFLLCFDFDFLAFLLLSTACLRLLPSSAALSCGVLGYCQPCSPACVEWAGFSGTDGLEVWPLCCWGGCVLPLVPLSCVALTLARSIMLSNFPLGG